MSKKGTKGNTYQCTTRFGTTAAAIVHPNRTRTHPMVEQHAQAMHQLNQTQAPSQKQWRNKHGNVPQTAWGTGGKSVNHASIFPSPQAAVVAKHADFAMSTVETPVCGPANLNVLQRNMQPAFWTA
mmetsp:Transcript_8780/g.16699  ORF Transcript_8780/g.16699 Transcript_8780/m.16699 type:complete len:126 (+) Transcript_8780:95-472(+)